MSGYYKACRHRCTHIREDGLAKNVRGMDAIQILVRIVMFCIRNPAFFVPYLALIGFEKQIQ